MIRDDKKRKAIFDRMGKRWREEVDKVKEYEIIEEETEEEKARREEVERGEAKKEDIEREERAEREFVSFFPSGVGYQEYREAQRLKEKLLEKYEGKALEDAISGEDFETEKGMCYHIENQGKITLKIINPDKARKKILSNLKLIYGIGEVTEYILKDEGYKTVEDLTAHPRFGSEAARFLEIIEGCDTYQIIDWMGRWLPKSHPLVLYSSGLRKKEDFAIVDIETMGLFSRPIILFGVAQISGTHILISQYFLRSIKEEPAALVGFLSHIGKRSIFITFNGRAFDIPYIRERLAYYRMRADLERPHFDVLHFSRRAWREKVPDCRLATLEKYLFGIERKDEVPSALVPEFYETYLKTKNIGPLLPIIEHNRQDLVTLASIFSRLHEEWG